MQEEICSQEDICCSEDQNFDKPIRYAELSRRDVRSLIFHILYAFDAYDYQVSVESIVDNLNRGFDLDIPLQGEAVHMTQSIADSREALDKVIEKFLANWRLERLGVSTLLILRIGAWELLNTETASNVIINEAVELAKCFSEIDAYKFINGVLDEMAKKLPELKK